LSGAMLIFSERNKPMDIEKYKEYREQGICAVLAFAWMKQHEEEKLEPLGLDWDDSSQTATAHFDFRGLPFSVEAYIDEDTIAPLDWEHQITYGEIYPYFRKQGYCKNEAHLRALNEVKTCKERLESFGDSWVYFCFNVYLVDPLSCETIAEDSLGGVGVTSLRELAENCLHEIFSERNKLK